MFNLNNLIKKPTCFKARTPRCIDLFLTTSTSSFKSSDAIETGLSDFHSMIITVLKDGFVKRGLRTLIYRDFRRFDQNCFRQTPWNDLQEMHVNGNDTANFSEFILRTETVLNEHAPIKKKIVRANDGPFMTKTLRKEIMTCSRLRNINNKDRNADIWRAYKKQRNKCVQILRQAKANHYKNLDIKCLEDNRKFWKTVKPLFSNKIQVSPKITSKENDTHHK